MKIRPVEAELFHADGRTHVDVTKPIVAFRNFTNASKNVIKKKVKQSRSVPEGSRKLGFPDFMTTAQDGGKVVIPTHRPPLPTGNTPGTHFC
jgi:hypothetical protein